MARTTEKRFNVRVYVTLKPTVNDPQGNTIASAIEALGFEGVERMRAGKLFTFAVAANTPKKAAKQVDAICSRLLANPVIETYEFDVAPA